MSLGGCSWVPHILPRMPLEEELVEQLVEGEELVLLCTYTGTGMWGTLGEGNEPQVQNQLSVITTWWTLAANATGHCSSL